MAKILVVEDESQIGRVVRAYLERAGHLVITAADGHVSSLRVKLLVGFALVILVAVGVVALAANVTTSRQFDHYLQQGGEIRARRIAPLVAEYYARQESWQGIERLLAGTLGLGVMRRGLQQLPPLMRDRVVLADAEGTVVFDSQGQEEGHRLTGQLLTSGVPILVDGQRVGTALVAPWQRVPVDSLERRFLMAVNRPQAVERGIAWG